MAEDTNEHLGSSDCSSGMLLQLPDEDASIYAGDAEYRIPADWKGVHKIVSECGWWIGTISIVQIESKRYVEWLQSYSLRFDDD